MRPLAHLDPADYVRQRLTETRPTHAWSTGSAEDTVSWQGELRAVLETVIGLPDEEPPALEARYGEAEALDDYTRLTVRFTTRSGLDAFAYLLVPNGAAAPRPAVLCLPGHGRGVDSIVGIGADGGQRGLDAPDEYAADFALRCVREGYVALALEQISFGRRRDARAREQGPEASSCARDSTAALMLGETIIGWRVWDAMRALDLLLARPDLVDPARVAVMGISGGGLTALFTAALDTRVCATVISGYLNRFDSSVLAVPHCVDNYAPGLRRLCEMSDVAGLVAPRPLFAENGTEDPIFPVGAFREAVRDVAAVYTSLGASEDFDHEVFDGGHRFHGEGAFRFLAARLGS